MEWNIFVPFDMECRNFTGGTAVGCDGVAGGKRLI
jgi:hypothetical protein